MKTPDIIAKLEELEQRINKLETKQDPCIYCSGKGYNYDYIAQFPRTCNHCKGSGAQG